MKKLIASMILALVVTAFGASTVFADGGQLITDRVEKQRVEKQADVAGNHSTVAKMNITAEQCLAHHK